MPFHAYCLRHKKHVIIQDCLMRLSNMIISIIVHIGIGRDSVVTAEALYYSMFHQQ